MQAAQPVYETIKAAPQVQYMNGPQVIQGAPVQTQYMQAPVQQYAQQPQQVVEQFIQAPAQQQVVEYIQQAPAVQYMNAPAVEYMQQPAVEYVQAAPAVMQQPQFVETVAAAPNVTYEYISAAPAVQQPVEYVNYAPQTMSAPAVTTVIEPFAQYTNQFQPQVQYAPQPQSLSYIPAAAPLVVEAPASYLPPVQVQQPVVQAGGQASVIVETVGDWLVCEDGAGHFFFHNPTQQSYDNPPAEFLALFPTGYGPPPLGAFGQAPMAVAQPVVESYIPGVQYAQPQMFVEQIVQQPQMAQQVTYAGVQQQMAPQVFESYAPQQMMQVQQQFAQQGQYGQPMMATVLN
jgi:hypothetical protein